jgi:hypothetical protein
MVTALTMQFDPLTDRFETSSPSLQCSRELQYGGRTFHHLQNTYKNVKLQAIHALITG